MRTHAQHSAKWRKENPEKIRVQKLRYRLKQRAMVDELKSGPCMDCGGKFPPECMDFDHVRPGKIERVSHLLEAGRKVIMAEIAKCELVCSNCHRIRTRKRTNAGSRAI